LEQLKQMNAGSDLGLLTRITSEHTNDIGAFCFLITKARRDDIDYVVSVETRIRVLERELQDERRRRMEVEIAIQEIERECREPFVVPELLQAFIAISKLTGEALL
jgi:hypothetical protein